MIFLQSGNQFSMNIGVLLIIIAFAMGAGYLLKLFIEQFILPPKDTKDNKAEYLYHIELLQNKFSAEIIRKDEDLKMIQDELKAAEQKNFNLQLQYAKSLKQIEKTRHAIPVINGTEVKHDHDVVVTEELVQLRDKAAEQEKAIDGLQTKLQEAEQAVRKLTSEKINGEEKTLVLSLQQKTDALVREKEEAVHQLVMIQKEKHAMQDQFFQKMKQYSTQVQELETKLSETKAEAEQQLEELRQKNEEFEKELAELRNRKPESSVAVQKQPELQDIQTIRTEVEQVTSVINNFKLHLNTALENSYPYEQLLADTEKLKEKIQTMDEERLQFEQLKKEEIKQLTDQYQELENKLHQQHQEKTHAEHLIHKLENEKQAALSSLASIIKDKEDILHESETLRNKLQQTIELLRNELQQKEVRLHELMLKENKYKEMLYTVKDLENQFSRLYPQLDILEDESEISLNTNGQMR